MKAGKRNCGMRKCKKEKAEEVAIRQGRCNEAFLASKIEVAEEVWKASTKPSDKSKVSRTAKEAEAKTKSTQHADFSAVEKELVKVAGEALAARVTARGGSKKDAEEAAGEAAAAFARSFARACACSMGKARVM